MDVARRRSPEGKLQQRSDTFTGTVWGDPLLNSVNSPGGVGMSTVYFSPGSRTFWHRHEAGQTLFVVSGEGMVATREGAAARVQAGDVVWAPPGEEHWHGAGSDTFFVHTSSTAGATHWLDEVTPEDYTHAQDED
jgi:quercetin dioxygenase-like cupin family protein